MAKDLLARRHLTIAEAADVLGVEPWEVVRLAEAGDVETVQLVDAGSLARYQEARA